MRDGHSSGTPVARRLKQPTRTAGPDSDLRFCARAQTLVPSLFGLAPGGVYHAACVAVRAVRSYRTFSPLPQPTHYAPRRFVFCGTFPRLAPAGRYPAPTVHGARTFLSGNLSVLAGAAVRPTDQRGMEAATQRVKGRAGQGRGCARQSCGPARGWRADRAMSCVSIHRQRHRPVPGESGAGKPSPGRASPSHKCR
jgi:hypothetical protein